MINCFICNKKTKNHLFCNKCIEHNIIIGGGKYKNNNEKCKLCNSKRCKPNGKYQMCIHFESFRKYFKLISQINADMDKHL